MKIAVSSEGDGNVAEHFGRCPEFALFEAKDGKIVSQKNVKNPYYENHVPGAVPKFIESLGADVLITKGIGPSAIELFGSLGIKVIFGVGGDAKKAAESYLSGKLKETGNSCSH